ncbi:MAG: hypothetical protein HZB51_14640 [Chloroflexi bacterium]|nr:hypothetical protein [Chloroflexota bacterium]
MNRKTLVILAGAVMLIALFALMLAPVQQVAAQGPATTPVPPVAVLKVVAVPGYVSDPNAITATVSYVTDSNISKAASATAALYTSGLGNVPIKAPVVLQVSAKDPKNTGTATWSLTKPADSKATITGTLTGKFTPDVPGAYMVSVQLRGANGNSNTEYAYFNAGTYIGATAGNCKQCHPKYAEEWAKTAHATLFSKELDNQVDGPAGIAPSAAGYITHYSETCARCHTTGYYPVPLNGSGGYWDAKTKAGWVFPTWKQIDEVFTKKAPSNWQAAPADVKNMGTIGCEVCHGPASAHVKDGAKTMQASFDNGVCNQCHGAAANHSKGWQLANSKHSAGTSFEEINGPARAACMRCHGAEGFVSFLKNPKNQAAWSTEEGSVGCATCHDPHSEETPFQLRVVGKPIEVASLPNAKDVGLSAICETCHWSRRDIAADTKTIETGGTSGYSHYSSAAELLNDTGGYTYGQTLPNSPHGAMVGTAPVKNPAYDAKTNPGAAQFKWSSPGDAKGNTPGSCVACHMWDAVTSPMTSTLAFNVGGHSFNTVTPDGKTDDGRSCQACHGAVTDFNLKAKADYDGNGKAEGVQDELKGLLNITWKALEAKGWKQAANSPYGTAPADADAKQKAAFYNFRMLYGVMWATDASGKISGGNEGKASAVHNFKRSCALLQLSLKELGATPAGAADCTK